MREDDRARLLKSMVKPDVWLNAPTLGAADLAVLGSTRANQDKSLREQQESKLKQVAPLLGAISAGGSLLSAAASITDAQEREAVQVGAKRTIEHISGCLNLLAFDISALQVKRRTLALRAYSAVSGLTIEPTQRSSDWSLVPGGRVELDADIISVAAEHRRAHRERQQILAARPNRPSNPNGGGGGGAPGGRGRSWRRREARRQSKKKQQQQPTGGAAAANGGATTSAGKPTTTPGSASTRGGHGGRGGSRGRGRGGRGGRGGGKRGA